MVWRVIAWQCMSKQQCMCPSRSDESSTTCLSQRRVFSTESRKFVRCTRWQSKQKLPMSCRTTTCESFAQSLPRSSKAWAKSIAPGMLTKKTPHFEWIDPGSLMRDYVAQTFTRSRALYGLVVSDQRQMCLSRSVQSSMLSNSTDLNS